MKFRYPVRNWEASKASPPAFGLLGREVEVKDGMVRFNPVQDQYKEYLTYLNKLFTEKLLDEETFVQTSQQMTAKAIRTKSALSHIHHQISS